MSEAASSCMRFCEYLASSGRLAAFRPLEDAERARLRLSPAEAQERYRRVAKAVREGAAVHVACQAEGVEPRRFRGWLARNRIGMKALRS